MLWIISGLFSWAGLNSTIVLAVVAVIAALVLGVPRKLIWVGLAALAVYMAVGYVWRASDDACRQRNAENVARLEAEWKIRLDVALKENKVFLNEVEMKLSGSEAELAELQAARDEIPDEQKCFLETQEDVDAFNRTRR